MPASAARSQMACRLSSNDSLSSLKKACMASGRKVTHSDAMRICFLTGLKGDRVNSLPNLMVVGISIIPVMKAVPARPAPAWPPPQMEDIYCISRCRSNLNRRRGMQTRLSPTRDTTMSHACHITCAGAGARAGQQTANERRSAGNRLPLSPSDRPLTSRRSHRHGCEQS